MKRMLLPIAVAIALSGCDSSLSDKQRDQAADIAGDVSADPAEVAALETKVAELEQEVQRLSNEDNANKANIDTLFSKEKWAEDAIDTLYENDRTFAARTGLPLQERR